MNLFSDVSLALGQLSDRRFLKVFFLGLGLTVGLLAGATWGLVWLVGWLLPESFTLFGYSIGLPGEIFSAATIGLMLLASVFLMVPVASAFTGLFLDEVAEAVESSHYPHLPPAPPVNWGEALKDSISFLGLILIVNLVALILYFMVGPFAPILFWIVNGFLLGREYFQLVAMRRVGRAGAKAARRRHLPEIWLAGALMAAPLSIPIVNLFVPILGAATFTHLYHRLESRDVAVSSR
ncbi:EI24 domain-containing protein [Tropicimonas sp. TH_r6]|uniref:EI24 domain-containing protein n=1 Tax=Tropicimonas sp. TH_r6 TaxID=3082085 RepID=UPI00295463F6|nr:EI24 domain-containing protein [Tropicimonas sp. TH_r6]MDV7145472.1 EI24 domain-containing protein [Tropicimonas sp. TH_r6]